MSDRTKTVFVCVVTITFGVVFVIGVLAGWWPYEWWRAFGLGGGS